MGLLDRARDSRGSNNDAGGVFLQKIQDLNTGVDYPVVLFQQLLNHFSIEKAAVFFRSDTKDSFYCLSLKGYDKTTSNRLRMDENCVDSSEFSDMIKQQGSIKSENAPVFLKDYMSTREFGLFEEIYWLPFFYENKIICVIMISQWKKSVIEDWQPLFNTISKRFSHKVFNSRKSLISQKDIDIRRPDKEELLNRIRTLVKKDVYLIEVDLQPLIQQLMDLKEGVSIVNLKKEILSVFRTMSGPEQELIDIENHKILLILDKKRIPDKSMFIHQISSSLPLLFQGLKSPPILSTRDLVFPETDEEQEEFIGTLM